ncbi:hypothetical protein E5S69_20715 [Cupriavidus necator]|uniref:hypothetical protein n=1 Tax=Cupriavidus necator TaxID=106590 RepID=UPI0014901DC7|nr:hypothetical protein [Cupriavidus necator]NOV25928.1 hypothetical protein [Cupriavidus necator]
MDCFCDYDAPEFYVQATHKARKAHRCNECRRQIKAGENYERASGKWDGQVDFFKTCEHCVSIRQWVKAHVPCACLSHGNLIEDAIEYGRAYAHEAPGFLFGIHRRRAQARRAGKEPS